MFWSRRPVCADGLAFKSGFFSKSSCNQTCIPCILRRSNPALGGHFNPRLTTGKLKPSWTNRRRLPAPWKTWEKGSQSMTGCDRQCHANRFPTNCSCFCLWRSTGLLPTFLSHFFHNKLHSASLSHYQMIRMNAGEEQMLNLSFSLDPQIRVCWTWNFRSFWKWIKNPVCSQHHSVPKTKSLSVI